MATAADLHAALLSRGQTVAAAESLTAGLFCATLAEVPGASRTLRGGAVVYATDLKATLAGVDPALLDRVGPVARETALALAGGIAARCGSTWGVGLTGVAGPDPVDDQPAGTVWVGLAGPSGSAAVLLHLPGDRAAVRAGTVAAAIDLLAARVVGNDPADGGVVPAANDAGPAGRGG